MLHIHIFSVCFSVNIILLSVSDGEEVLVLTFTILAKTVSNIGWFIMWVQAIEVRDQNGVSMRSIFKRRVLKKKIIQFCTNDYLYIFLSD